MSVLKTRVFAQLNQNCQQTLPKLGTNRRKGNSKGPDIPSSAGIHKIILLQIQGFKFGDLEGSITYHGVRQEVPSPKFWRLETDHLAEPLFGGPRIWATWGRFVIFPVLCLLAYENAAVNRPYPQYGWDFPEELPEKFRKDPGNALRAFPGIPLDSTAGIPQALSFKAFEASRAFPELSPPPVRLGTPLFSELVPERASQSCPWNSQQY